MNISVAAKFPTDAAEVQHVEYLRGVVREGSQQVKHKVRTTSWLSVAVSKGIWGLESPQKIECFQTSPIVWVWALGWAGSVAAVIGLLISRLFPGFLRLVSCALCACYGYSIPGGSPRHGRDELWSWAKERLHGLESVGFGEEGCC